METPREYYYTYYSYEEYGRGYIGSRKCYCLPEEDVKYFGSFYDKTFRPTKKIILKDDYATREEAYADEIILQQYYKVVENPHFTNKSYQTSTNFYVSKEISKENGKIGGNKAKELGLGIHALTPEERSKNAKILYESGIGLGGLTPKERIENGKIAGTKIYEMKVGVHGRTKEQKMEDGKIGGNKAKELGLGIHALTLEERAELGKKGSKKTNAQKWICLETGYVSNSGALSNYQKARGIDTSKRKRIS